MADDALDRLARTLAAPVGRRRALQLLAATAVAVAVPGARPRGALGDHTFYPVECGGYRCQQGMKCCNGFCCSVEEQCCQHLCCPPPQAQRPDGARVHNFCNSPSDKYGCSQKVGCPYGLSPCGAGSGAHGYSDCCNPRTQVCKDGRCRYKCATEEQTCGKKCCSRRNDCVNGRCVRKCSRGRVRCRDKCCESGQRCVKGRCRKCDRGQNECAGKCCRKADFCCGNSSQGTCCPKKGGSCCPNRTEKGKTSYMCCKEPTHCARPAAAGGSGSHAGVDFDANFLCCPKERFVSQYNSCCPSGHVALKTFQVLAGGGGGHCCRKDKLCGDTCCASGTENFPELDQTCCNGTCTRTGDDPRNCGRCGNVCPSGHCRQGVCVA